VRAWCPHGGRAHAPTRAERRAAQRGGRVVRPAARRLDADVRRRRRPAQFSGRSSRDHRRPTAIRIERRYAASAKVVFEAWTSAEMLRRWYPPGADWDTPVAEVDLRVGGRLRIVMRSPERRRVRRRRRIPRGHGAVAACVHVGVGPSGRRRGHPSRGGGLHEHPDGTTTVVMTNRGVAGEQARESHREGWEGPSTTSPGWCPDDEVAGARSREHQIAR
jgi:hypothetical protein